MIYEHLFTHKFFYISLMYLGITKAEKPRPFFLNNDELNCSTFPLLVLSKLF